MYGVTSPGQLYDQMHGVQTTDTSRLAKTGSIDSKKQTSKLKQNESDQVAKPKSIFKNVKNLFKKDKTKVTASKSDQHEIVFISGKYEGGSRGVQSNNVIPNAHEADNNSLENGKPTSLLENHKIDRRYNELPQDQNIPHAARGAANILGDSIMSKKEFKSEFGEDYSGQRNIHSFDANINVLKQQGGVTNLKVAEQLESSLEITENITQLNVYPSDEFVQEISAKMRQQVEGLKPGESCIFPCGTDEHAILMQMTKQEDGKITCTIYNSGEGSQMHYSKYVRDENGALKKMQCMDWSVSDIEPGKLNDEFFSKMISIQVSKESQTNLTCLPDHYKSKNPKNQLRLLYKDVENLSQTPPSGYTSKQVDAYMKGSKEVFKEVGNEDQRISNQQYLVTQGLQELIPADIPLERFSSSQGGGTCTEKCINALVKNEHLKAADNVQEGLKEYKGFQLQKKMAAMSTLILEANQQSETPADKTRDLKSLSATLFHSSFKPYWDSHAESVLSQDQFAEFSNCVNQMESVIGNFDSEHQVVEL